MQNCQLLSQILGPSLLLIVSLTVFKYQYLMMGSMHRGSQYILFEQNGSYHPLKQSWKHYNPKQAKSGEAHRDEYRLKPRKATPCICLFFFKGIFFGRFAQLAGSQFPNWGSNVCPLWQKHRVLTTRQPGNSQYLIPYTLYSIVLAQNTTSLLQLTHPDSMLRTLHIF